MTDPNDEMLEDLFAQARDVAPLVSDDLMARVLADAARPAPQATPATGPWGSILDVIGGWMAIGGLATATLAGLWIGVAPPATVADLTAGILGETVTVQFGGAGAFAEFGEFEDG